MGNGEKIVNLENEVIDALHAAKKHINDIKFVSVGCLRIPTVTFLINAGSINYVNDYGAREEINFTLKIVFRDGSWLERGESDGRGWFRYMSTPVEPSETAPDDMIKSLLIMD